jgi:transposase
MRVLPEVISIDEFKGNSGGQKYNTIVADPKGRKVLDILPNRFEGDLIKYFSQFPSKNDVKYYEWNYDIFPIVRFWRYILWRNLLF